MTPDADLDAWIARQAAHSADAMARAISATGLSRRRDAFGQVVIPSAGSVLASPVIADWDPEPDYFFHWLRDSAIVMSVVADLMGDAKTLDQRRRWRRRFQDFVTFSLGLTQLDGAAFLAGSRHRQATRRGFRRFLRSDAGIRSLSGDRLLGEPRFNPDGTIDVQRWSRPQYDGPALRALACLRYLAAGGPPTEPLRRLLRIDLDFTARYADRPCIGPWEERERPAHHYQVAVTQYGALVHGRAWVDGAAAERRLLAGLERHWSAEHGVIAAVRGRTSGDPADLLDASILVGVVDAGLPDGPHSPRDPRIQATLGAIEDLFARELPINHGRTAGRPPALGRWRGDRYFGGGAWYPTTLAAASLCYRLAVLPGRDGAAWRRRGDGYMRTVRALTPADGSLSEQVDRATGVPTSARYLTWSYAAFIAAARLRAQAR